MTTCTPYSPGPPDVISGCSTETRVKVPTESILTVGVRAQTVQNKGLSWGGGGRLGANENCFLFISDSRSMQVTP